MVKPGALGKVQRSHRVVEMGIRVCISGRKLLRWPAVGLGTCAGRGGRGGGLRLAWRPQIYLEVGRGR